MEQMVYAGKRGGCGLASLKMLLIHYQKQRRYAYMESERNGDLESLRFLAESEGVALSWKKSEDHTALLRNKRYPLLLLLEEGSKKHLVYLRKRRGDRFYVYDPDRGEMKLSVKELFPKWTGVYGEGEFIKKVKCPYKKMRLYSVLGVASILLSSFLAVFSLAAAFYFFKEDQPPMGTFIFLASFGLFFVLERFLLIKEMSRFDDRYLRLPLRKKERRETTKGNYMHFLSFKKQAFLRLRWWTEGPFVLLVVLLLFGLDSPSFWLSGALLVSVQILSSFFVSSRSRKGALKVMEAEEKVFSERISDQKVLNEELRTIKRESYSLCRLFEYRKILSICLLLALSFIPVLFEQRIELNYFLLQFFALFSLHDALAPLCEMLAGRDDYLREMAFFSAHFSSNEAERRDKTTSRGGFVVE